MAYSYWKHGRSSEHSVFDLFFRENPFKGHFTVFCGLEESIKFVQSFKFDEEHLNFIRSDLKLTKEDEGFIGVYYLAWPSLRDLCVIL